MIQARSTLFMLRLVGFINNEALSPGGTQGGDPTGTGRGGESIYGEKFEDEITRVRIKRFMCEMIYMYPQPSL